MLFIYKAFAAAKAQERPIDPKLDPLFKNFVSNTKTAIQKYKASHGTVTDGRTDPITKGPLYNPVKNTVCGHVYGKDSIMEMLSQNHRIR